MILCGYEHCVTFQSRAGCVKYAISRTKSVQDHEFCFCLKCFGWRGRFTTESQWSVPRIFLILGRVGREDALLFLHDARNCIRLSVRVALLLGQVCGHSARKVRAGPPAAGTSFEAQNLGGSRSWQTAHQHDVSDRPRLQIIAVSLISMGVFVCCSLMRRPFRTSPYLF